MSLEASRLHRAGSPALSGRSSPVDAKKRLDDDGPIKTDKATRRYAVGIDRALSLFDNALQDWADYLPFLGRLLKALQVHPPGISDVPHTSLVAQRLSQCLNPALPSGVHQKALEVYTYIFSLIGKDGLGRDLPHYLPGLSPVLAFASLSTKPSLLALFDTFIVALDPAAVRPALKAILLALLPGLEEESSEEFERTHDILQRLRKNLTYRQGINGLQDSSGDQFFWQCLFLATITSPSRRQGALAYLQRHLPRLGKPENTRNQTSGRSGGQEQSVSHGIEAVTSPEPGLLIRCFAAGLSDPQVLIQRGFLDMLVTHLPLHSEILHSKVIPGDLVKLAKAAVSVVLRREMSLNRRLWSWFLGSKEPSPDNKDSSVPSQDIDVHGDKVQERQLKYFQQYGLNSLVQGIMTMFETDAVTTTEKARPFRVALALMDRWEIGSLVVPIIFLPALKSVWRYQKAAPTHEDYNEVLRSASSFFDGVESGLIWDEISNKLLHATDMRVSDLQAFHESLELALFVVTNFDLQEEEMLVSHIPLLALSLLVKFGTLIQSPDYLRAPSHEVTERTLQLTTQLLDVTPERAFDNRGSKPSNLPNYSGDALEAGNQAFLASMREQYQGRHGKYRSKATGIDRFLVAKLSLSNILHLLNRELQSDRASRVFEGEIAILEKLLRRTPAKQLWVVTELLAGITKASKPLASPSDGFFELRDVVTLVTLLETIHTGLPNASWLPDHRLRIILPNLVTGLWPFLSPSKPKSNIEAVRCIWKIQSLSVDTKLLESCISALMVESSLDHGEGLLDIENARRFAVLWSHSNTNYGLHARQSSHSTPKIGSPQTTTPDQHILARPLLLLLDTLEDPKTDLFTFTTAWLRSSANVHVILDFLQKKLQETQGLRVSGMGSSPEQAVQVEDHLINVDECQYYIRTTLNIITHSPNDIWPSLLAHPSDFSQADLPETKARRFQVVSDDHDQRNGTLTTQRRLIKICLGYLRKDLDERTNGPPSISRLQQTAVSVLEEVVLRSTFLVDTETELEYPVLSALLWSIQKPDHSLQVSLMGLVSVLLGRRLNDSKHGVEKDHRRIMSADHGGRRSMSGDGLEKQESNVLLATPPPILLDCLLTGLASTGGQPVMNHWIHFLGLCLPFYVPTLFQILIPLVDCLTKALHSLFGDLQSSFQQRDIRSTASMEPVNTIIELLNGVEQVLARAHDQLAANRTTQSNSKPPDQAQGFFGNMVSGVFPLDVHKSRSAGANNRLTVLLCFKDAVKLCLQIWSWGNGPETSWRDPTLSGSFSHISLRLKNRSRRILEHMFAAESLECLETLMYLWRGPQTLQIPEIPSPVVLNLLHVLDGSRPRNTIPAIFNALYSRTNPGALDPERKSTLTSELSDVDIARFLVEYTRSLEDDTMDEIWSDCMTFLKDVLTNPLPHRQTLPRLLDFTALLGIKVDNTNFGENRKRRRELADLFLRQLTATFTAKPISFSSEPSPAKGQKLPTQSHRLLSTQSEAASDDVVAILATIIPYASKVLVDSDRITTASNIVSAQVVVPTFRWKTFPRNVTFNFLDLLLSMARITEASKVWRKDVAEAFNDSRFFCDHSYNLASSRWLPILREWINSDKDRMDEFLSRMPSPTSAGIMFGVGASSARLEADRKIQLNLRRVATLLLAAPSDSFVVHLGAIQAKVMDLLTATAASSPSSATRAEIYIVLRALMLKNLPIHLASLWPAITTELHEALSTLYPGRNRDKYNMHCVVHACKLLDILVAAAPDDFQMRQWLFVTDSIDAVYRPQDLEPRALVDDLIDDLDDASAGTLQSATINTPNAGSRKPLLNNKVLQDIPKEKLLDHVIRPFLRQLSINTFEGTYSMAAFDWPLVYEDLLFDIFDDRSLV
ncbi:MAG: hypothetical protein Q9216_003641 [Gyalolechia sp. 2 TL-2023]